jgi:monoterpene epsilon-lactone hydrolase
MASEEFRKLTAYMAANPMPRRGHAEMREQMKAFGRRARLPEGMQVDTAADTPVPARIFTPAGAQPGVILFAHGGGFTLGSIESHGHVAAWLAQASQRAAVIFDYRLAPEHPCPAALEDLREIHEWAVQRYPSQRIVLAGDSAGANLSLSVVVNRLLSAPAAIVALSPSLDLAGYLALDPSSIADKSVDAGAIAEGFRAYLGNISPTDSRVSPINGDLRGLPPLFIQVAEQEVFAPGALEFAERATGAGAIVETDIWPEMLHDWHWYAPRLPEAREALERAGDFIRRHAP